MDFAGHGPSLLRALTFELLLLLTGIVNFASMTELGHQTLSKLGILVLFGQGSCV